MSSSPIPPVLRFWRWVSTAAVLLVSLAFVFWEVDVLLGYPVLRTTREEGNFLMVIIMLFPPALSMWLKLCLFPPARGCNVHHHVLGWCLLNMGVAFLTGVIGAIRIAVEDRWIYHCLTMGLGMMIVAFVLGIPLLFLLYFVCRKCRG